MQADLSAAKRDGDRIVLLNPAYDPLIKRYVETRVRPRLPSLFPLLHPLHAQLDGMAANVQHQLGIGWVHTGRTTGMVEAAHGILKRLQMPGCPMRLDKYVNKRREIALGDVQAFGLAAE